MSKLTQCLHVRMGRTRPLIYRSQPCQVVTRQTTPKRNVRVWAYGMVCWCEAQARQARQSFAARLLYCVGRSAT